MYSSAKVLNRGEALAQQIQALEETLKTTSNIALRAKLKALKVEFTEERGFKRIKLVLLN